MKKISCFLLGVTSFVLSVGIFHINTYADMKYSKVYAGNQTIKKGDYIFEYKQGSTMNKAGVKIRKKGDKKPVKTLNNMSYYLLLNDERIYYVKDKSIMCIDFEDFKSREIIELNEEPNIENVRENDIFFSMFNKKLTKEKGYDIRSLYRYNVEEDEEISLLAENGTNSMLGTDRLIYSDTVTAVSSPTKLFSIDFDGEDEIKLSDSAMGAKVIDDRVYYCQYKDAVSSKGDIYSSNLDGSDKIKLSKKKVEGGVLDITDKDVTFIKTVGGKSKRFKMDFATGELKKIR